MDDEKSVYSYIEETTSSDSRRGRGRGRGKRIRVAAISFTLTTLRIWQWLSAFCVGAGFRFYTDEQRALVAWEGDVKNVLQSLGLVILVYSTLVVTCVQVFKRVGIPSWRVFAILSLPCDLGMMGLYLVKISMLVMVIITPTLTLDPAESTSGPGGLLEQTWRTLGRYRLSHSQTTDDQNVSEQLGIYELAFMSSIVNIFSYTLTIVFTILFLQQQTWSYSSSDPEKVPMIRLNNAARDAGVRNHEVLPIYEPEYEGSIFEQDHVPQSTNSTPRPSSTFSRRTASSAATHGAPPPPPSSSSSSRRPSFQSTRSARSTRTTISWGATTLASSHRGRSDSVSSRTSLMDNDDASDGIHGVRPELPRQRRWSTSTSSSYNAGAFVVADGFRPEERVMQHGDVAGNLGFEDNEMSKGT